MSTSPHSPPLPPSPLTTPAKDSHRRRSAVDSVGEQGSGSSHSVSVSPTGSTTTISDLASSTTHRFTDSARIAALRNATVIMSTTPYGTPPRRRPVLRADPTLLTCFDPTDKELYDLWAPK